MELAHLSDSHVGFSQYPKKAPSGRPQREQDFVRAFSQVIGHICDWDPALVIHSGDFYDRPVVSLRHQKQGQDALAKLAGRPDGSKRVVIVISGNHDQPSDPREPCALELDTPIEGVHVVTSSYKVIDLADEVAAGRADQSLQDVVIHAIPHDVLRSLDFDDVQPIPGRTNILVAHGVVGGSDMYKRTVGREYALPTEVVVRGWDYVAMGHWHKRGPVAVGGMSETTTPVWYAGSIENNGFADVTDGNGTGRGYVQVAVEKGQAPRVTGVDLPVRAMFKLPEIKSEGLEPDAIRDLMISAVKASDIDGAVVSQPISGISRDVWNLVDLASVRSAASSALWYEARPIFTDQQSVEQETGGQSDLAAVLERVADSVLEGVEEREPVMLMCRNLLADALDAPVNEEEVSEK